MMDAGIDVEVLWAHCRAIDESDSDDKYEKLQRVRTLLSQVDLPEDRFKTPGGEQLRAMLDALPTSRETDSTE